MASVYLKLSKVTTDGNNKNKMPTFLSTSVTAPGEPVSPSEYREPTALQPSKQTTLLDGAATAAIHALLGAEAPPTREALSQLIKENTALVASGDKAALASALARQATALEVGMHGLLAAMARASKPEHHLTLAKAAATLHGACMRSLGALHEVRK